jgi:hypothetical protein
MKVARWHTSSTISSRAVSHLGYLPSRQAPGASVPDHRYRDVHAIDNSVSDIEAHIVHPAAVALSN